MMMNVRVFICTLSTLLAVLIGTTSSQTAPITDSFKKEDLQRVEALAQSALASPAQQDLASLFYASSTLKILSAPVKGGAKATCDFVKSKVASSTGQLQNAYYVAGINKALTCGISSKGFETTLKTVEDEKTKMQDKFYGVQAAADFASLQSVGSPQNIIKSVSTQLTSNVDTPLSAQVYGVHIASVLAPKAPGTASPELNNLFSLVEDIVGQADEVNEKYLQLEGGLGVTALFVEGAFNLAAKMNKLPLILQNKLQQMASYIMSRKDSQSLKSVYFVVLAATTLSHNTHFVPVSVSLDNNNFAFSTNKEQEKVRVRVSNLMGGELKTGQLSGVTAEQVERNSDAVIIVNKEPLKQLPTDKTVYTLDLLKLKPGAGFYTLTVSVSSSSTTASPKLVGVAPGNAKLSLRVLTEVTATNMNIAIIDADSSSTIGKQTPVSYPSTLKSTLFADSTQKVVASFSIKDKHSNLDFEPHQVFMRLVHIESEQEVFFVCEKQGSLYEFEMKVRGSDSFFKSLSGDYEMYLIVGDAVASNSFMWQLAKITLAFAESKSYQQPQYKEEFQPKPEIHHLFRTPEPRPSIVFSQTFALLAALPLLVLLAVWSKMGVNVSNMELDVATVGFHGGLAAIFALYYCYWAHLNMFQTLKYLTVLGAVTFFCGHKLLKKLAITRVNNSRVVGG